MDDRGSVVPLVAAVVLVAGVLTMAIGRLGEAAVDRAVARTAADAAALAGAAEGRQAARSVAQANGARLTSYREVGPDALVRVTVGQAAASARARRDAGVQGGP